MLCNDSAYLSSGERACSRIMTPPRPPAAQMEMRQKRDVAAAVSLIAQALVTSRPRLSLRTGCPNATLPPLTFSFVRIHHSLLPPPRHLLVPLLVLQHLQRRQHLTLRMPRAPPTDRCPAAVRPRLPQRPRYGQRWCQQQLRERFDSPS